MVFLHRSVRDELKKIEMPTQAGIVCVCVKKRQCDSVCRSALQNVESGGKERKRDINVDIYIQL